VGEEHKLEDILTSGNSSPVGERVHYGRPFGRAVKQRAKAFEAEVGPLLGELLERTSM